ncbi:MAG: HEAT repeat domain-containing protein, partial [Myxococcota bacterium]|nr:HEAT repeat domain-containing protein [Myxococcota bacterium]
VENNKRNKQQLRRKDNDVGPDLAFLGMLAALALGEQGRDALLAFLDHPDLDIHRRALLLTLLLELGWARETPQLALAAMSSRHPRTRLSAAWAVECWPERERFAELVTSLVNDRGDTVKPGPLSIDTIQKMAAFLAHDASTARMRVASLLWYLNDFDDENQVVARRWALLARRYESEMASCLSAAKKQAVAPSKELQSLVLGAYIGLLRQGGPESIRVSAIARLGSIAEKMRSEQDSIMLGSVFPSLLMALRDSYANVRKAAFEALLQLSFDRSALAAEALATGIDAMGAMGLELLTRNVEQKKAFQVLSRVVLEHTDGLEREAFTQLCKLVDEVEAIEVALEASSSSLQLSALYRLVELAHRDERALASLRKTLQSRFRALRLSAADMLARRQDESAFEPLVALLQSNVRDEQERAATALLALRHPKSAEALLARIENDPAGSASALRLLQLVGDLRNTQAVAPLCAMMLDAKWSKDNRFNATQWKRQCLSAALKACGHDQRILDPQDERPDKTWLEKQSPRDDKALATILETLVKLGDERALLEAIPKARWSQSNAVDAVLAAQVRSSNDALRQAVVEAIAWRARKRGAKLDALYTALGVAESMTQFLAAEGLALTGHAEGVGTLLTAAEMMTDDALRIRAVEALGKLGDARALELLLRHAKDNESALRPAAIEALGHLSKSPKEKEIFTLLEQLVKRDDDEALPEGVRALRYFGSAEAWLLLRQLVAHEDDGVRCAVAEELRYDQDPGSVELLLKLVSEDEDQDTAEKAVESLRARLGDAVEIDYAQLQSMHEFWADDDGELLRRIRERGDAGRLLDLMPKFDEELQTLIGKALLSREPLPVDACAARLDAVSYEVATLSMYVLGRAGEAVAKAHGKAMGAACGTARLGWARELGRAEAGEHHTLAEATKCWSRALWACARCGVAAEELLLVAESNLDAIRGMAAESTKLPERGGARPRAHRKLETSSLVIAAAWRELRTQALLALGTGLGKKKGLEALERSLGDDDAAIRSVAAGVLKTLDAARAAAAVGAALDDAVSLHLLVDPSNAKAKKALAEAAGSTHHQGLALSHLIAAQDVAALTAAAGNRDLVEAARLGAIEALGCVTQGSAQKALLGIATDAKEDEELRKAAWRALRRAKRWAAKSKEARV